MTCRTSNLSWLDVLYNSVRKTPGGVMDAAAYLADRRGKTMHPETLRAKLRGLASPGAPLRGRPDSFEDASMLEAGRLQAAHLNQAFAAPVAGGRLVSALLQRAAASCVTSGRYRLSASSSAPGLPFRSCQTD